MALLDRLVLPDGRTIAYDDVGDPHGRPVVYLHGTPDSRRSRHPDDGLAERAGVRLLAVDRPGAGASDPHPGGRLTSLGHDLGHLLDHLALERVGLLGWSAGGLAALAAATVLGDRVAGLTLVAPVPPIEAYADPRVLDALGPARRHFVELAQEVPAAELGAELAPYLVPDPLSAEVALEHVREAAGPLGRADLDQVPGAAEALAAGLAGAVQQGWAGLAQQVALQLELGLDLAGVRGPVRTIHGDHDEVSPPEVGAWLVAHLPQATAEVVAGAGHHLLFPRWAAILAAVVGDEPTPGVSL